jgi:signal transduction histidine kinase
LLGFGKGLSHLGSPAGETDGRRLARFLAEAAHDLRQPLQGLEFMVDALAGQAHDSDSAALAQRMQGAVDCLRDMFETVVELCRLEGGLRQTVRTVIAVDALVGRVLNSIRQSDIAGPRRLTGSFAEAAVLSDELLLAKLLRHLLLNAVAITVEEPIDIAGSCRDRTYELRISVPCTRLAQALLERAFIELRSGDVHRPVYALGLATLRRYAECLGHPLEVRIEGDCRFVLTLELPLTAVSPDAHRSVDALTGTS